MTVLLKGLASAYFLSPPGTTKLCFAVDIRFPLDISSISATEFANVSNRLPIPEETVVLGGAADAMGSSTSEIFHRRIMPSFEPDARYISGSSSVGGRKARARIQSSCPGRERTLLNCRVCVRQGLG